LSYEFDKENVKLKKVKASELNPVNKTNNLKEALRRHVKGSGPAGDRYNSSPQLNVSDDESTLVDPSLDSKVETLKRTSGNEVGPRGLR
jgi:hypothetical protein